MAKLKWTYDNTSDEIELKKDYTKETIWPHILRVYNQQDEWVGDAPLTNNKESALKLNGNLNVGSYQIADWWIPTGNYILNNTTPYPQKRPWNYYWKGYYTGSVYNYKLNLNAPKDTNKSFTAKNSGSTTSYSGHSYPDINLNNGNGYTSEANITGTGIWYTSGRQETRSGTLKYAINYSGSTYYITQDNATFGYSAEN